jgi:riboflavin kinase/FMN adenylyltransferase
MKRWHDVSEIPPGWGPSVVTIGLLDGMHRGHVEILQRVVQRARERRLPCVVQTFDRDPLAVLEPDRVPLTLMSPTPKADLIESLGVDAMLVLRFTRDLSEFSPETFVRDILAQALRTKVLVIGDNLRFGYHAEGDLTTLTRQGALFDFEVEALPLTTHGGSAISATAIRALLLAGDVDAAAQLLGRPYRTDGIVVRGAQRGRELGFPTANQRVPDYCAVPADGVYAGRVVRLEEGCGQLAGEPLGLAAISIGMNPTFNARHRSIEAFVLDYDGDLYDERIGIEYGRRLRAMERFHTVEDLVGRITLDVQEARVQ